MKQCLNILNIIEEIEDAFVSLFNEVYEYDCLVKIEVNASKNKKEIKEVNKINKNIDYLRMSDYINVTNGVILFDVLKKDILDNFKEFNNCDYLIEADKIFLTVIFKQQSYSSDLDIENLYILYENNQTAAFNEFNEDFRRAL